LDIIDTFFNQRVFIQSLPLLLTGLWVTIMLGAVSIVLGMAGGLFLALLRLYAARPLQKLAVAYIDVFRAMPLLVLLVIVYYALPFLGIRLSPFLSAVTALSLVSSAYSAEIFRAGIEAVPVGQFEAAKSLGLRPWPTMLKVILPQAVRIVVPPLTSNSINVMKDTALASVVAMPDLLKQATQAQALEANPTPLIVAALMYIAILWPLVYMVSRMEKSYRSGK